MNRTALAAHRTVQRWPLLDAESAKPQSQGPLYANMLATLLRPDMVSGLRRMHQTWGHGLQMAPTLWWSSVTGRTYEESPLMYQIPA